MAACTADVGGSSAAPRSGAVESTAGSESGDDGDDASDRELVYETVRVVDAEGNAEVLSEVGELDPAIVQRAARPWSYLHEDLTYVEEAWSRNLEDDIVEHGYRIWREEITPAENPAISAGAPVVDPRLDELLESVENDAPMAVDLQIRNFPDWNLPVLGSPLAMSADTYAAMLDERDEIMSQRAALLETMTQELRDEITSVGGEISRQWPEIGWLSITLPPSQIDLVLSRDDIGGVMLPSADVDSLFQPGPPYWRQGDGRWTTRTEQDAFHAAGHDGLRPNNARHAYGRVTVSVVEEYRFEDEACAFTDGPSCIGTRIAAKCECHDGDSDTNYCETVANHDDDSDGLNAGHGTKVAAALLGDYTDDQGCGAGLNDPDFNQPGWPNCHSTDWEKAATGMAPEAKLVYFGRLKPLFELHGFTDAINDSIALHVDILNGSIAVDYNCSAEAGMSMFETAVENAFDDGILPVFAAGNVDGPSAPSCNLGSPADLVKTLAVNAFDACRETGANCDDDCLVSPSTFCHVDQSNSARGGVPVNVQGAGSKTLSGVDMLAPNNIVYFTYEFGDYGGVDRTAPLAGGGGGTSIAAPQVAGSAALLKDKFLADLVFWVNNPGRLQAAMLAMTDRHWIADPTVTNVATTQRTTGADVLYGVGRLHPRLLKAGQGYSIAA